MEINISDMSYDKKFKKTGTIKFYPYVGNKYKLSTPRILILGESHYIPEKPGKEDQREKKLKIGMI
jgi:hypothetical protein